MSKLNFDEYNVKKNVDYIETAYEMIKKSVYSPGTIRIPYEFKYAKNAKYIFDENEKIMNKLLEYKNLLVSSMERYSSISEENEIIISEITKVED